MTAMLIALPQGFNVSGVTLWGVRLAGALTARGHTVGLAVHAEPPAQNRLDFDLDSRVRLFDMRDLPPLASADGLLAPWIARYRDALHALAPASSEPVVFSPNLHGDCYGIGAAITQVEPDLVRLVGWQHSDIEYDARVLTHYAPVLGAFVAVSHQIELILRDRLAPRAADIEQIPYGVEVPPAPPPRTPIAGRPLRLLYTGRIEHEQKRVRAFIHLTDMLTQRGISHRLTLLGDGPASHEIDAACRSRPALRRCPPTSPAGVRQALAEHDAFILASRYEGLSVAMLEALAAGCVPIVTAVRSGAAQAIRDGRNGLLAQASPDDDDAATALALADAVERFLRADTQAMSRAAWSDATERFSIERHTDRVEALLERLVHAPPRSWPTMRPCAFSSTGGSGSGSVPVEAAERLRTLLGSLSGKTIALHGAGRHTIELASILAHAPANIVALTDDDPARHGQTCLGWPILAPAEVASAHVTDVIISSWMHHEAIWSRRDVYERRGVRLHRLYDPPDAARAATQP